MALANPNGGENVRAFVLARRAGMPEPMVVRKRSNVESFVSFSGGGSELPTSVMGDFLTGNIELKVHDEWGTYIDETDGNLFDVRGAYYSSGTAP